MNKGFNDYGSYGGGGGGGPPMEVSFKYYLRSLEKFIVYDIDI